MLRQKREHGVILTLENECPFITHIDYISHNPPHALVLTSGETAEKQVVVIIIAIRAAVVKLHDISVNPCSNFNVKLNISNV